MQSYKETWSYLFASSLLELIVGFDHLNMEIIFVQNYHNLIYLGYSSTITF